MRAYCMVTSRRACCVRSAGPRLCTTELHTLHITPMRKLPARFEPLLFSLLLSGLMSLLVSAVATWHGLGWRSDFADVWIASWLSSWLVAFPAVLVVAPVVRKLAARCVEPRA